MIVKTACVLLMLLISSAMLFAVETYTIHKTSHAPLIDGKLTDACWKGKVLSLKDFRFLEGTGGGAGPVQTEAWMAYDDLALYVGVRCAEPAMNRIVAQEKKHDGDVWRDDEIELFLNPSGDRKTYVQIGVNSLGVVMDASFSGPKQGMDTSWESGAEVGTSREGRAWTVEMRIPLANLPLERAGDTWTFHIARNRQGAGQLYTSLHTPVKAFHVLRHFDNLKGITIKGTGMRIAAFNIGEMLQGTNVCTVKLSNDSGKEMQVTVSAGIGKPANATAVALKPGRSADVELVWELKQADKGQRFVLLLKSGKRILIEKAVFIDEVPTVFGRLRPGAYYFTATEGMTYALDLQMAKRSRQTARLVWRAVASGGAEAGRGAASVADNPAPIALKWPGMRAGLYQMHFELNQNGATIDSAAAELAMVAAGTATSPLRGVWAVNDGEKLKRFDIHNINKFENSIWDRKQINLFSARNELIGFQVILQTGAKAAAKVDISLPELKHASGMVLKWKPESADTADYAGRQIERFTQHYLQIKKGTNPGWFYHKDARPRDMTGWIPDALVPANAAAGRGGLPIDIGPEQNQGIWLDVYVPRDAPAGEYRGTVAVTAAGKALVNIPVSLKVMDFVLPDENHFNAMVYFSEGGTRRRHGRGGDELLARYHRLAKRHRVEFTHTYSPDPGQLHADCVSGAAFTAEQNYEGPGEGIGYRIIPASFYGINQSWQGGNAWRTADRFMNWIKKANPKAITFLYITDEPPASRFAWIKEVGNHHHQNKGPGGKLPMFVTKGPNKGLEGAIDIWCTVSNHVNLQKLKAERAKGRTWWYYNGQRPQAGTGITGAPAVDPRVGMWGCWKHDIELWFYWHANHWRHNSQYPRGDQNVWSDPVTFGGAGGVNGDGVVVYAGQDEFYREQDRGLAGPIASIRLKNIRRGMQDYEYLWLAAANGLKKEARAIADTCVPAAFSNARGDASWSIKGTDWDNQRLKLAKLLEKTLKSKR